MAIFLLEMEDFSAFNDKLHFKNVKDMTPKKVAEGAFEVMIDSFFDEIRDDYRTEVKKCFIKNQRKPIMTMRNNII